MSDECKEKANMGKGIGNENRYRVLEAIMPGERTVGEIAAKVKLAQPAVSQHLKVLKSSNLVQDVRRGKEVYYSINVAYMMGLLKKMTGDVGKGEKKKKNIIY